VDDDSDRPRVATEDYINSMTHNGVPPSTLDFKLGAVCSIMRNFNVAKGLVKHQKCVITALRGTFVEIRLIDGPQRSTDSIIIPRISFKFRPPYCSFSVLRKQIPLRLAYACTFNGVHGMTLDASVVDCRYDAFAHGQLYTAISRIRTRGDGRLLVPEDYDASRNVVSQLLLQ
jgi:hypothetical protein